MKKALLFVLVVLRLWPTFAFPIHFLFFHFQTKHTQGVECERERVKNKHEN
jgi:hypothetical protein